MITNINLISIQSNYLYRTFKHILGGECMSKILLTGASGYIGSHLKNKLKKDHEVIAISRNTHNKTDE